MFTKVKIYQFRNFKMMTTVNINRRHIVLRGGNGQGKTSFLEAIYYLSVASSFKEKKDNNIVSIDHHEFSVSGNYETNGLSEKIIVNWQDGHKQIKINDFMVKERKELLNRFPCFVFSHDDMKLAEGEQEHRRRFFDQLISFLDSSYIDLSKNYRLALKQRNGALRLNKLTMVDLYTESLIKNGFLLNELRKEYLIQFNTIFTKLIKKLIKKDIICILQISWKGDDENAVGKYIEGKKDYEIKRGVTLYGPHRDKYNFIINGREAASYLSTGEKRALSLALKCASANMVANLNKRKPTLLIDDAFLELEHSIRAKMIEELPDYEQAFFTFLPQGEFFKNIDDPLIYDVKDGKFYSHEL